MSKGINKLKINQIKFRSNVMIPCASSKIELDNYVNPFCSTTIHPIFAGSADFEEKMCEISS